MRCEDNKITFMNMSGMYSGMDDALAEYANSIMRTEYIECSEISGTECYCDDRAQELLRDRIMEHNVSAKSVHYIDNGNYHYLTKIMLEHMEEPFNLLVIDNHPDMQSPLFGPILSCGSWVKDMLSDNKHINRVCLYGVKEDLITEEIIHTEKVAVANNKNEVMDSLEEKVPLYISIDKDALNSRDYITNWDQGSMRIEEMEMLLKELAVSYNICGTDICGGIDLHMMAGLSQSDIDNNCHTDIRILKALGY